MHNFKNVLGFFFSDQLIFHQLLGTTTNHRRPSHPATSNAGTLIPDSATPFPFFATKHFFLTFRHVCPNFPCSMTGRSFVFMSSAKSSDTSRPWDTYTCLCQIFSSGSKKGGHTPPNSSLWLESTSTQSSAGNA